MPTVLMVCTGNTCRSPMAAALMRRMAEQRRMSVTVLSAGTAAAAGLPATPEAQAALLARGIDMAGHRSQPVTPELIAGADLVLTMTASQKEQLLTLFPEAAGRTHTLAEYAGGGGDVQDPIGGSAEVYRETAAELERLVRAALDRMEKEAEPS